VHLLNTETGSAEQTADLMEMLKQPSPPPESDKKPATTWEIVQSEDDDTEVSVKIEHPWVLFAWNLNLFFRL
jgi:hypothetical protein